MVILQTIAVAFSMFSALPMPQFSWTRENMRYALCAFPLVGAAAALILWGAFFLLHLLPLPSYLSGAILTAVYIALTGGIHLDGFMDTFDALSSHKSRKEKLLILADPHVGAFAVIYGCLYLILLSALWGAAGVFYWEMLLPSLMLSRSLSGLAVVIFPKAKKEGLAHTFSQEAAYGKSGIILAATSAALLLWLSLTGLPGLLMAAAAAGSFGLYYLVLTRIFGGTTGDLAGWFLSLAELAMLAVYVLCLYAF